MSMLSIEVSCSYYCWSSMLGGLVTPTDFVSTSLGIGLSLTVKLEREYLGDCGGGCRSLVRAPVAKSGGSGFDSPVGC